jgi:hypothetical protein
MMKPSDLVRLLSTEAGAESCGDPSSPLVVDLDAGEIAGDICQPACPVIGVASRPIERPPMVLDLLVQPQDLDEVKAAVAANPVAVSVLTGLLRHNERASVRGGLFAESLAYSSLQHGAEFECWLETAPPSAGERDTGPLVLLEREDDRLTITLNRPDKHNAFSADLRDALCEALHLPLTDATIEQVVIDGAGCSFCAGGDLTEFGEARDSAVAHLTRMTRSAAWLMHRLRERLTVDVHGACIGAGIELPAYAGRIVARDDAFFQLPEVSMGLIPGAGGTVSVLARIGRLRCAFMAVTGRRVGAEQALRWGLVDEVRS